MRSTSAAITLTTLMLLGALATDVASRAGTVPAHGFQTDADPAGVKALFLGGHGGGGAVAPILTGLTAEETYSVEFDRLAAGRDEDDAAYGGLDVFKPTADGSIAAMTFQRVTRQGVADSLDPDDVAVASVNATVVPAVAPEPAAIALMTVATSAAAGFAACRRRRVRRRNARPPAFRPLIPVAMPRRGR